MAEPELGQVLRHYSDWLGVPMGRWYQHVKAEWLGPYTPTCVENWVLKLMREDPQLKFGLNIIKSNFVGLTYRVRGGSPHARRLVEKTLADGKLLQPLVKSILNALDFGHQVHEILWGLKTVEVDPRGKGAPATRILPNAYVFEKFLDIDPERVCMEQDERGELVGIRLDGGALLSPNKAVVAVHDFEWQNYYGRGLLRAAYNPFYWCNFLYLYKMRYGETRITPTIKARGPFKPVTKEDDPRTAQQNQNTLDLIGLQALNLRNGSVASLPSDRDEKTGEFLWDMELMRDEGRIEQFMIAINHQQAMKLRAILIPERSATQDTSVGSFASIREMVNLLLGVLEGVKQGTIIPQLNFVSELITRANFGPNEEAPYFEGSELVRQNREALFKLLFEAAKVPRTLEDGKRYTGLHRLDLERAFEAFDVPFLDAEDVAEEVLEEPAGEGPIEPRGDEGEGEEGPEPAGGDDSPTDETAPRESPEEASPAEARPERATGVARRAARAVAGFVTMPMEGFRALLGSRRRKRADAAPAPAAAPVINITNNIPEREVKLAVDARTTIAKDAVNVPVTVPERQTFVDARTTVAEGAIQNKTNVEVKGGNKTITRGPDGKIDGIRSEG